MPFKNKEKEKEWRKKWWSSLSEKRKEEKQKKANHRNRLLKQFLADYKLNQKCKDCGYSKHHSALEFIHIKGKKSFNISFAKSISQAKKEIEKCEVICSNCHRVRTYNRIYPCKPDIFEMMYEPVNTTQI